MRRTVTKTYTSGRVVQLVSRALATYPEAPVTGPDVARVPVGTRAVITGEASGVEYKWDGERAVPAHDPGVVARLQGLKFANPWLVPVLVAVVALAVAAVGFRWLRRRRASL